MNDYIEWKGGKCPVDGNVIVNIELRDGRRAAGEAFQYTWFHDGSDSDIVGYRAATSVNVDDLLQQPIGAVRVKPNEGEHTGGHSSYYDVTIETWTNPEHQRDEPVTICCNDIIEALDMNYAQGNAFKALWRIAAAKQGKLKKGNTTLYDAEKVDFFSDRILLQESIDK